MQNTMVTAAWLWFAHAGAAVAQPSCISVEVNGVRTLPYACLSEQLLPETMRNKTAEVPVVLSARNAQRPANELGVFNRSATAIRMGTNFGHSAQAQRPPLPAFDVPRAPAH